MKMTNIRILSQNRVCVIGKRKVEYFNVVADTERFGESEIMFQGTFESCIEFLTKEGYQYTDTVWERNNNRDIQITNRMFKIISKTGNEVELKSREGFKCVINLANMTAVAPNTFKMPLNYLAWEYPNAIVKFAEAKAW